jgi:hypothetical protein
MSASNFTAERRTMKKLITALASTLVGLAAYGQGMINFANFVPAPANINAPFFMGDGVTKVPVGGYQVSLLVGTTANNLSVVDTVGLAVPGYIGSKTETLAGIPAGTPTSTATFSGVRPRSRGEPLLLPEAEAERRKPFQGDWNELMLNRF